MVHINKIEVKGNYRIIWLRYISGVNLSEHCMKSFIGYNDKRFRGYNYKYSDLDLPKSRYYYFCCVEENFTYHKNIHIAFREKEGSIIKIDHPLIFAEILNAELMPITNRFIDWSLPYANNKLYNTCRNWWFANQIAKDFNEPTQASMFQ